MEVVPSVPCTSQPLLLKSKNDSEGHLMEVEIGSGCMYNATKMCAGFGKLIANYSQNKRSARFLAALEKDKAIPVSELLRYDPHTKTTWVHELVAINLAAWLSEEFELCMTNTMLEYLKKQVTDAQAEAAQAAMQGQRQAGRQARLAIEEDKPNSLERYLRDGGFKFGDYEALQLHDFWREYQHYCFQHPEAGEEVKTKKYMQQDDLLMAAADKVNGPGTVSVGVWPTDKKLRIIKGFDIASIADEEWRSFGPCTMQAFFAARVRPAPTHIITKKHLKAEYEEFCFKKGCAKQNWDENTVLTTLRNFEKAHPGTRVEPKHHRGIEHDGIRQYKGLAIVPWLL